jgi:hypothetical protein
MNRWVSDSRWVTEPLEETEPVKATVDHADIRGLVTTLLVSVGYLPRSRDEHLFQAPNVFEGCTNTGAASHRMARASVLFTGVGVTGLGGKWCLFGDGPDKGGQFAGDGDGDLVLVFALVHQGAVAFAESDLRLPADVLKGLAEFFEAQLQMPADLGRIAVGPGALDQDLAGVGVAGFGDAALTALPAAGVLGGGEAEIAHELSWIIETGQVAEFGDERDGGEELYASEGLDGLDHGEQAPVAGVVLEFGLQALHPLVLFGNATQILLEDDLLRGGVADDFAEPAQMGGSPVGLALVADILAQQKGLQAELGGLEILEGVFAGAGEIADRLVGEIRDVDGGEVAAAHEAGERDGIAAVGLDAVAGLSGDERGGDHPAGELFSGEIAIQPIATGAGLINEDQPGGFGLQCADQFINVALTGTDGAEGDDGGVPVLRCIGDRDGFLVDVETDVECSARLFHG